MWARGREPRVVKFQLLSVVSMAFANAESLVGFFLKSLKPTVPGFPEKQASSQGLQQIGGHLSQRESNLVAGKLFRLFWD